MFVPLLKPARYKGAWGGRGSGKSHFFAEMVVEESLAAKTDIVCIREVQKSLRSSVQHVRRLRRADVLRFFIRALRIRSMAMLKTMLEYKGAHAGIVVREVNESFSTQVCSCCGVISASSPKGRAGLRIREWTCVACGSTHDRDINAARNILGRGRAPLAVGIPVLPRVSGQPEG